MEFIACDCNGRIVSMVNTKSEKIAIAFWKQEGFNISIIKILKYDCESSKIFPFGIYSILETKATKNGFNSQLKKFIYMD